MKVGLYCRVSTQEQALNGHSIDEQIDRMTKYCNAMEWEIAGTYTDAGFSGASTERPALQKLIKEIKTLDKVLVYKLDRLSRSQKDTLMLIEDVFLKNNTDFVSMTENFDTSTPFGKAMIGILAVFAQLEREQIKERMTMGQVARAKQGKFHGSAIIPVGYDYIDGELIVNEYEKIQVQKVFELYAQGFSPWEINQQLTDFTRKGKPWHVKEIRDVLERKTYLGYVKFQGQWYKGTHEPLITQELFDQVQEIRKQKRIAHTDYTRRDGRANSYLGGFLICANCGGKYSKSMHKKKDGVYNYYVCNSRSKHSRMLVKDASCKNKNWRMEELDNIIFNEIKKLAISSEFESQIGKYNSDNSAISKEIAKLDNQIDKLIDLYAIGNIPQDVLQKKIFDLARKKTTLESKKNDHDPESTIDLIHSFSDILELGDFREIRSVISSLIQHIELDGENVHIHWNF